MTNPSGPPYIDPWGEPVTWPSNESFLHHKTELRYLARAFCPGKDGRLVVALVNWGFEDWLWTLGGARRTSRSLAIKQAQNVIDSIPADRTRFEAAGDIIPEEAWAEEAEIAAGIVADLEASNDSIKIAGQVRRIAERGHMDGLPCWCPGCGQELRIGWDGRHLSLDRKSRPENGSAVQ